MFKFLIFVSVVHNVAVHSEYTRWHATRDEGFVSANIIVEGKRTFKSNEFHVKKNVKRDVLLQDVAGKIANFASNSVKNTRIFKSMAFIGRSEFTLASSSNT